ncbi:hypothetical protein [Bacillus cereus]|uniref:hypothetical protein n=1 Tax=Bacillus cereus TaxID=1396 RepID=UPI0013D7F67C|nr:hypothetical protein [Bacillus cereus]
MSETVKYKQMSIYDFLPEEKSQEVQPSETDPQVDEAQVDIYGAMSQQLSKDVEDMILGDVPSSALDAKESIEDTDSTLFSVGDVVKVRQARDLYLSHIDPEDYFHMKEYENCIVSILKVRKHLALCMTHKKETPVWFKLSELQNKSVCFR